MKIAFDSQTLKMVGGGAIIAGACAIMFPGLLSYVMGLSRLLLLVVVTIGVAAGVTLLLKKLRTNKTGSPSTSTETELDDARKE